MVCKNCGQKTSGIKINKKYFCTNCGEAILMSKSPQATFLPKISEPPRAKIIPKDEESPALKEEEVELGILEAEKETLEIIAREAEKLAKKKVKAIKEIKPKRSKVKEEKAKPKAAPKKPIIKHERPRVGTKTGYEILKGEPDPINEPELPIPHDDMIEKPKEPLATAQTEGPVNFAKTKSEQRMAFLTKEEKGAVEEKRKQKTKALKGFFQKGVIETSKKKTKKKREPIKKWVWGFLLVLIVLISAGVGFVYWVNTVGTSAERAKEIAEEEVNFSYVKPKYMPVGYELYYKTNATENSITYIYAYKPDIKKSINVIIEKSDITNIGIFERFIKNGKEYAQKSINDVIFWTLGDNTAVFVKDGVLYQIVSSDTISTEELTKIVEGLI